MSTLLTIFTPTYNRAALLPRLYESLKQQKLYNFEWVIVDDGSVDNTEEIVRGFIDASPFPIIYYQQNNQGKHIAINKGVELANGILFFIVDSDDHIISNAIQTINYHYETICDNEHVGGMAFRRGYTETNLIGSKSNSNYNFIAGLLESRYTYKLSGDMAEIFKTSILRQYPFPVISGEKFCPESFVWNRMSKKYKMLWLSQIIYICEYLESGLTKNKVKVRQNSPKTLSLYYAEYSKMKIPLFHKIKSNINFWRFAFDNSDSFSKNFKMVNPLLSLIGIPTALILRINN